MFNRLGKFSIFGCALALALPNSAIAAESICPGGSNRRSDISWCADFENSANPACVIGNEAGCAVANALDSISGSFLIKSGDGAVGNSSIVGAGAPGGTGPGYASVTLPGASTSASMRFYVKFKDGYLQSSWSRGNHGPAIEANDGSGCFVRITLDWFADGPSFATNGTCAPDGGAPLPNNLVPEIPMKNNRWYLVEMQAVMNTTAGAGTYNGNGVFRAWIDGVKVMEHTNLNIRGSSSATFKSLFTARSYYGVGGPPWAAKIAYDNFAFSNNGTYIGGASNENPRAPGDVLSPYVNFVTYDGMVGAKLGPDCSSAGEFGFIPTTQRWRDSATSSLQTAVTRGQYRSVCPGAVEKALAVSLSGPNKGGGMAYELATPAANQRLVLHGSVYLPSSNAYTANTPLSGFARYGGNASYGDANQWGFHVGLGVVNGKWALIQRNDGAQQVIATNLNAGMNQWSEFEIHLARDNKLSLMVNGNWLLDEVVAPLNISDWAWDELSAGPRNAVVGVIDHRGSGSFNVYHDDVDIGTASFWSCKGWSPESCPFSGPAPQRPNPPSGVSASTTE